MIDQNKRIAFIVKWQTILILLLVLGQSTLAQAAIRRAAVYFSDGKVLTGRIALTSGRKFKLNIPEAGKLKTSDMVTGEDVQYRKIKGSSINYSDCLDLSAKIVYFNLLLCLATYA